MPARTVSRRGTSKASATTTVTAASAPDELATQVKTRLKVSKTASSSKRKAEMPSDSEIRRDAMQSINSTSQKLSKAIQEGWKSSCTSKSDFSSAELQQLSKEAFLSISELRRISLDGMDVEKAAGSIIGKLISLEMVRHFVIFVYCYPKSQRAV
jgi:separase